MTARDQLAHCPAPNKAVCFFKVIHLEEKNWYQQCFISVGTKTILQKDYIEILRIV